MTIAGEAGREKEIYRFEVPATGIKGNPVRFGSGPVAVTGDEIRADPTAEIIQREGAESRGIRKPEDLP